MNMLLECWGQSYAHIVLTAEAGTLPMDQKKLKKKFGLTGAHSQEEYLACHARVGTTGSVEKIWESDPTSTSTAAIFEIVFGTSPQVSRERSGEKHYKSYDQPWVSHERSGKRHQVSHERSDEKYITRAGLRKVRCCVLHLHHKTAMKPHRAREWLADILQACSRLQADIICGDANHVVKTIETKNSQTYKNLLLRTYSKVWSKTSAEEWNSDCDHFHPS